MRVRIVLALALVVLVLPAAAQAYVISGRPWPGHTITYFNADKRLARAVAIAANAWNTSGARVHLVAVPRSRARVVIRSQAVPTVGPAVEEGTCFGYGDVGYQGRQEHIDLSPSCTGLIISAAVATHEFGHILGLNHPSHGCETMTAIVWQACKYPPKPWQYRCRFVWPDDVRGAIRLYGGRVRAHPKFCTAFRAPAGPTDLRVAADGRGVTWHNPATPRPALPGLDKPVLQAFVSVDKGSCPKTLGAANTAALANNVQAGRDQSVSLTEGFRLTPGTYCYAVFVQDQYSRSGPPATAMFTVPNQAPTAAFTAAPDFGGCFQLQNDSTDPDGQVSSSQWDFGAPDQPDNTSSDSFAYHCYQQSGTYTVTLTVTDDSGAKATTTQQLTATVPPPEPPPQEGF